MASVRVNSVVCLLLCLVFVASDAVLAKSHGPSALSTIDETLPEVLEVPEGNEVQQMLFATGYQIYLYNGTAWNLHNVSADLYNFKGIKIGHHFFLGEKDINGGQASWETFHPYTRVTAKTLASVQVQSDSIAWLLVQATTNIGKKKFMGATTYVQRIYTHGGLAPSADYPAKKGDVFDSTYTSLYKFSASCD